MSQENPRDAKNSQSAPRVSRQSKKRRDEDSADAANDAERHERPFDFGAWLPAGLTLASLVVFLCVSSSTVPKGIPSSTYLWHKFGFLIALIVIITPVLMVSSALLGICYGDTKDALVKLPAIILTQIWAEDLLGLLPQPYVGTIGAWVVTLFLFVNAFELESWEAVVSMCVVRGAHTAAFWLIFAALLTPPKSEGEGITPPNAVLQMAPMPSAAMMEPPAQMAPIANHEPGAKPKPVEKKEPVEKEELVENKERAKKKEPADKKKKADTKEPGDSKDSEDSNVPGVRPDEQFLRPRPVPPGGVPIARSISLTQKFGDALVAADYGRAYALMSPAYKKSVTLGTFTAIHRQAIVDYGSPLKAVAGFGDLDETQLRGAEFERFTTVPAKERVAWTYANLASELRRGETVRCYDCWLLLVRRGEELRVGAFEYEECE